MTNDTQSALRECLTKLPRTIWRKSRSTVHIPETEDTAGKYISIDGLNKQYAHALAAYIAAANPATVGAILDELDALKAEIERLKEWTEDDQQLPEDDEIKAARPKTTDGNDLYAEAMRLVGAKRSKYALIDLVNWLLVGTRADALDAARYRFLKANINYLPKLHALVGVKSIFWDDVIDELMKYITGSGHE